MSTQLMINELKETNQDFEWYPTTSEIINRIKRDIGTDNDHESILDCGAGDGRVLEQLTQGKRYAIEKSKPLLNSLDPSIFVVGTEFRDQVLIDKKVDIVFSNPPYSEYEEWAIKIINEANCKTVYLVIPERWFNNIEIDEAIKARKGIATVIGEYDFLEADRVARAKVNIVRIGLADRSYGSRHGHCDHRSKVDPFDLWFSDNFDIDDGSSNIADKLKKRLDDSMPKGSDGEIIQGSSIIPILEQLYRNDLEQLITTFQALQNIDASLMKELDINIDGVRGALRLKIEGLKDMYWRELFNNLIKITDRLCSDSRKKLLDTLTSNTQVDFTVDNAYAVVIWVAKNANKYFDEQLISVYGDMTEKANMINYKSNQKTFGDDIWRYRFRDDEDAPTHYKLDYRIVLEHCGGLHQSDWSRYSSVNGLSERAAVFLDDLRTIGSNLGFSTVNHGACDSFEWESGKKCNFMYTDIETQVDEILFEAKAFKNGNVHIKLNQRFIQKLNVEFGRLKGWINTPEDAVKEMNIPLAVAKQGFKSNLQIGSNTTLLLGLE